MLLRDVIVNFNIGENAPLLRIYLLFVGLKSK